jgi:uncharacterized spore protein YtfJ
MADDKVPGPQSGERAVATISGEVGEVFRRAGRVDTVFGAPVSQDGLTVVPVARARWGFGGRSFGPGDHGERREGLVGGGGMRVDPVGIVVLRGGDAEFRPTRAEPRWSLLAALFALGFVIGRLQRPAPPPRITL